MVYEILNAVTVSEPRLRTVTEGVTLFEQVKVPGVLMETSCRSRLNKAEILMLSTKILLPK